MRKAAEERRRGHAAATADAVWESSDPPAGGGDCASAAASAAAAAAAAHVEISDDAIRKLADLVLSEIRRGGAELAAGDGDHCENSHHYSGDDRGLREGSAAQQGGDGDAKDPVTFSSFADALASYGGVLLALLVVYAVVKFALHEYTLAVAKYRDSGDDDDSDSDDDGSDDDGSRKSRKAAVRFTWSELFWYRLDHHLSQSKWATPVLLLSVTGLLVLGGTALLNLSTDGGTAHSAWLAWTYVADPGTHADAEGGAAAIAVSLLVTVGGMLVFAMVVGIVSDALGEKVHDLKKGRSRVIESDHTLMLGWTDKSLAIIQEIALANESEGGGTVVVLAEQDKEAMEEMLEAAITAHEPIRLLGTDVVFRCGNPLMENELDKVSAHTARSIIALSHDNCDPDEADSRMVRQVLSLKDLKRGTELRGHVVVEMQDVDNRDLINLVAKDIAEVIVAHDMIGRLMIQCAREPGLANVLENMMGFDGAEFYFEKWPVLYGKTFLEITTRFDDAVPIGIKGTDGQIQVNPESDRVYKEGEKILCLAEDDDTYEPNDGTYSQRVGKVPSGLVAQPHPEKLLFCGWRRDMADMITQLDEYVSPGSELWLFNMEPVSERLELLRDKGNKEELKTHNLKILNAQGNPIVRRDLGVLKALRYDGELSGKTISLDEFDSVLILSDSSEKNGGEGSMSSDSRSLASLLLIQDIQSKLWESRQKKKGGGDNNGSSEEAAAGELPRLTEGAVSAREDNGTSHKSGSGGGGNRKRPQDWTRASVEAEAAVWRRNKPPAAPISEILNTHTRSLLNVVNCQGYVMSNEIVSGAIAVVSEERDMNVVLGEILSAEGCETYIRDVSHYLDLRHNGEKERTKSFWDVALRARQRREVALGYKPAALSFFESSELVLNPDDKMKPRVWEKGDKVIVFAFE